MAEAAVAADAGATLVGVNARDLATLEVAPAASLPSARSCPAARSWSPRAASATRPGQGGRRRRRRRVLVGETLVRAANPTTAVHDLLGIVLAGGWIGGASAAATPLLRKHQEEPMAEPRKILLGEDELPSAWFNIVPSMPTKPDPYLHPQTREPVGPDALAPLFPMALIGQEVSTDEWGGHPGPVLDVYKLWRPTPLIRALDLERPSIPGPHLLQVRGEVAGRLHKPNTAVPQAFYNKEEGIARLSTETGAGQWGSALAFACARFGLECKVYMVRASTTASRTGARSWRPGGECHPSPSPETNAGRAVLDQDPDSPGSLGIAISEAVEDAATPARTPTTRSAACSTTCCSTRPSSAWS